MNRRTFVLRTAAASAFPWSNLLRAAPVEGGSLDLFTTEAERDAEVWRQLGSPKSLVTSGNLWRLWYAQALFGRGEKKLANDVFRTAAMSVRLVHKNFFVLWALMDGYLACREQMDEEVRAQIERLFTNNEGGLPIFGGSTSNLGMLANVNCHLAQSIWKRESFSPSLQKEIGSKDPQREHWLTQRLDKIAHSGAGEFASRPYAAYNLLPLLTLAERSPNTALREKARLAYEISLAHASGTWLRGHWAAPSGRSYPDEMTQRPNSNIGFLWYYFGGAAPLKMNPSIVAMLAKYRPPAAILQAATDRTRPYVCRTRFDGGGRFQTSYVNGAYAAFSNATSGRHPIYGQTYPYGVMWCAPGGQGGFLWVTVPGNDGFPLGDHAHGVSEHFIQFLQHEGTLLAVVDGLSHRERAHPGCWFPYVLTQVPPGWVAALDEGPSAGRLLWHFGTVMIALLATEKFEWSRRAGLLSDPKSAHSEFRIHGENLAVAVETASPEDFPGATPDEQLKAFRDALEKTTKLECVIPSGRAVATYLNRHGDRLENPFVGMDQSTSKINGTHVDYAQWPLVENPWMRQEIGGNLLLGQGGDKR
jgi:hypothetical protein